MTKRPCFGCRSIYRRQVLGLRNPYGRKEDSGCIARVFYLIAALRLAAFPAAADVSTNPQSAPKGVYELSNGHSLITFCIKHVGISNYCGWFPKISGKLHFNGSQPQASRVDVSIDLSAVQTRSDELDGRLRNDLFETAKFGTATFKTNGSKITGTNQGDVEGDLTLHGVTRAGHSEDDVQRRTAVAVRIGISDRLFRRRDDQAGGFRIDRRCVEGVRGRRGYDSHRNRIPPRAIDAMFNSTSRYGTVAMGFHWLIAIAIITLLVVGKYMHRSARQRPQQVALYQLHKSSGLTVLALSIGRIVWRLVNIIASAARGHADVAAMGRQLEPFGVLCLDHCHSAERLGGGFDVVVGRADDVVWPVRGAVLAGTCRGETRRTTLHEQFEEAHELLGNSMILLLICACGRRAQTSFLGSRYGSNAACCRSRSWNDDNPILSWSAKADHPRL